MNEVWITFENRFDVKLLTTSAQNLITRVARSYNTGKLATVSIINAMIIPQNLATVQLNDAPARRSFLRNYDSDGLRSIKGMCGK